MVELQEDNATHTIHTIRNYIYLKLMTSGVLALTNIIYIFKKITLL